MHFEDFHRLSGQGVPDLGRAITRRGQERTAIRGEAGVPDATLVPTKGLDLLTGIGVPNLHSAIHRSGGEPQNVLYNQRQSKLL